MARTREHEYSSRDTVRGLGTLTAVSQSIINGNRIRGASHNPLANVILTGGSLSSLKIYRNSIYRLRASQGSTESQRRRSGDGSTKAYSPQNDLVQD